MTNKSRLVSGRVPVSNSANVTSDRYQFLDLSSAEPNLGTANVGDVLTYDAAYPGTRRWIPQSSIEGSVGHQAFDKANSAYNQANVTIGVDTSQNARMAIIEGTDVSQNTRLDYSNTIITIIQGVDVTQNTAIDATDGKMQSAYNKANTGGLFSGDVTITGNLVVNGVTTSVNTSTITTSDSLIKLANNNTVGDSVDIGFYGTYNSSGQKYAGLVRQAGSNFFLFKDITTDPTANTLPAGSLTGANTGILSANIVGYITSNGYSLYDYTTSLYNLANTQSNQIVVIQGTDVTQNTRLTVIEGTDVSQNSRMTIADGVDDSQNTRIDYSNVAVTIIQGVDLTQNTNIASTDGKMQSAYDTANSKVSKSGDTMTGDLKFGGGGGILGNFATNQIALTANVDNDVSGFFAQKTGVSTVYANTDVIIQANTGGATFSQWNFNKDGTLIFPDSTIQTTAYVPGGEIDELARETANAAYFHANGAFLKANASYNQANVTIGVDASQNVRIDYSNTALTIAQGVDNSQNVRLDFSNTRMTIIEGVDVGQNTAIAATNQYATSAFSTANNAYIKANNALANTTGTFDGTLTVTGNVIANSFQTSGSSGNISGANFVYANTFVASNAYIFPDGTIQTTAASVSLANNAYNQANIATVLAQAAYNQANVTIGVDTTQNTRLTVIEGTDVSQNVRLDYSNTAITIIQGVDSTQNTNIAATDGKMQSAYNQANTGTVLAQAGYNQSNASFLGVNTAIAIIQDTDLSQNTRIDYSNTALAIAQGTDDSQNVRLDYSNTAITIIQGTDNSQNSKIDYSNTAITIIQGVDATQNTNIASTDGKMQSAYNQANTGTVLAQSSYNTANNKLDLSGGVVYGNVTVNNLTANTAIISPELRSTGGTTHVYTSDIGIVSIDVNGGQTKFYNAGVEVPGDVYAGTYGGNRVSLGGNEAKLQSLRTATVQIQTGTDGTVSNTWTFNGNQLTFPDNSVQNTAFTGVGLDQFARNVANSASANTIVIQGVDLGQNTSIAATDGKMQSAYNQANTGTVLAQAGYNQSNASFLGVNTAITIIQGVDITQNTRLTVIEGTNASQNTRLDYSNSTIAIIQGTDVSQNARMTIIEGVDATQNTNIANKLSLTGAPNQTVTGNVTISQDLIIAGNLIITGNIASQNVQQLAVADPLIILGIGNYVSDTKDIGFASHYNDGTNAHAGIIRDSETKEFYVFQGYVPELDSNNNVIITDSSFRTANFNANYVKGNLIATTAVVNGIDLSAYTQATYTQANVTVGVDATQNTRLTVIEGTDASQNARLNYSNSTIAIIQGVDTSQNARMTIIEGVDVGQNNAIIALQSSLITINSNSAYSSAIDNSQNNRMAIIEGTDLSQNVRIDYSNTTITIIQGVDLGQNTAIAATDGKMQSAYNQANTGTVLAQAAFNKANTGPTGLLANSVIFANTAGYLSNTSNLQFFASNNTLYVANGISVGTFESEPNSIYVNGRVGFVNANNISVVYQVYNTNTNSLDTIFG